MRDNSPTANSGHEKSIAATELTLFDIKDEIETTYELRKTSHNDSRLRSNNMTLLKNQTRKDNSKLKLSIRTTKDRSGGDL